MFRDRTEAGKLLAKELAFLKRRKDVIVLAIPRGGVPVAKEVADAIGAPLDIVITRKIGAPGNPELAVGAVSEDGEMVLDDELVEALRVSNDYLRAEAKRQVGEIKAREAKYRGKRPYPNLEGKTVVIVDDGIATGSTIRAAVLTVRRRKPGRIIIAVPVGPPDAVSMLSTMVDKVVCLSVPAYLGAIGEFYQEFQQVDDETVRRMLEGASSTSPKLSFDSERG